MTIYVIVENCPAYDDRAEQDDIHTCLCESLGYFTDDNLAEIEVEKHNKKWRVEYVAKFDRQSLNELAEAADIYPLLDALVKWGCIQEDEYDQVHDDLERYGYVPVNPANYQPKRIRGRKIV